MTLGDSREWNKEKLFLGFCWLLLDDIRGRHGSNIIYWIDRNGGSMLGILLFDAATLAAVFAEWESRRSASITQSGTASVSGNIHYYFV